MHLQTAAAAPAASREALPEPCRTESAPPDTVFVFGSNEAGRHGRGAALFAARWRGAIGGIGEGLQGRSYAIPTKDRSIKTLPLDRIRDGVARFLAFAQHHPDTAFDVTPIGCGLAGYADSDIAPLFKDAPQNCRLPYRWARLLDPSLPARIIVAGSRDFDDYLTLCVELERFIATHRLKAPEIVSGGARGADRLGEQYAAESHLRFHRIVPNWDRYGKAAGMLRNQHMSFLASHLIAFWNGMSRGTCNMIETAYQDDLVTSVVRIK